jgi:serine/threonine-protein kinase
MCPEQAAGSAAIDARGDIYSLGAVAFFMLTGRPPFVCSTVGEYLTAHLTRPAPDLRTLRPDATLDLVSLVACCLQKHPGDRYQSATELDAALASCACAGNWSAAEAVRWWDADRTATFTESELLPK